MAPVDFFIFIFSLIVISVVGTLLFVGTPKCTTTQLHQVIAEVERCTKENVICSSEMKDKILNEVCGK
jgi:hypothetical protein